MSAFVKNFAPVVGRTWSSPSVGVRAIRDKLIEEGRFVYSFDAGDLPFLVPKHAIQAMTDFLAKGRTSYMSVEGIPEFLRAVSAEFARDGFDYSPKEIMGTAGAKAAIYLALLATIKSGRGDEVIILTPGWYGFGQAVDHHGGVPVYVQGSIINEYKVTPAQLEGAITDKTRWFIINSPSNPTGVTYTFDELQAFAEVLRRYPDVLILIDDAYQHLVLGDRKHINLLHVAPDFRDRTVIASSVSKGFCMMGLRIGWAAGPKDLIEKMILLQRAYSLNPSIDGQVGAIAALSGPRTDNDMYRRVCDEKLSAVYEIFKDIPGFKCPVPKGGFSHFVDVRELLPAITPDGERIEDDVALSLWLLRTHAVLPAPGASFHYKGGLRFSCVTKEEAEYPIVGGAVIVRDAMAQLKTIK